MEGENQPGGLCRSLKIGNSYYDIGAHALHQKSFQESPLLKEIVSENQIYCQKRKAVVYLFNRLIPHPLQYHLYYLPLKERISCLLSFLLSKNNIAKNLKEWLLTKLGNQICKIFLFPYNEKVWCIDLEKVSTKWTERVASGRLRVLIGAFIRGDKNYSSNEYVCYPISGGFENLLSNVIQVTRKHIYLNSKVISVDLVNKIVFLENNKNYYYDRLISTIPLDIFVSLISKPRNKKIEDLGEKLEKVSMCLLAFLTERIPTDIQRVYVPGKEYLAQRVVVNSNSSLFLKNKSETVISIEISYNRKNVLPTKEVVLTNCKKLLLNLGLISKETNILEAKIDHFSHIYPTQTLEKDNIIPEIRRYIRKFNCFTIGRFGDWDYSNIDGIVKKSSELAKELLFVNK